MDPDSSKLTSKYTMLTRTSFWCCVSICVYILFSFTACGPKKGDAIKSEIDSLEFSTMTRGVETLISDSGITKYKLVADIWYTYDSPESKWYFPEGIYLEQFDTLFHIQASVKADTAWYYDSSKLWHLVGNVEILSREGQQFYSNSLYWNQQNEEVYSHEHVRIVKNEGQELQGQYGFRSNQTMTRYIIFSSRGYMDINSDGSPAATSQSSSTLSTEAKADSIAIAESLAPSTR